MGTNKPTVSLEKYQTDGRSYNQAIADQRVEKGKATRERLLSAARELFGEQGYEATSIEQILAAASIARGALYHHFANKEELYDAVFEHMVAEIADQVADAAREADDAGERIRAACVAWLELAVDPAIQRIAILDPPAAIGWTRAREVDERYVLSGLRANLEALAADGRLPIAETDVLAHMVLAAVNEAALMIARADDPQEALAEGREAVETLLGRLVTGSSSSG